MKYLAALVLCFALLSGPATAGSVKPGDIITPDNASLVADLVSPGNLVLVKQGMRMKIAPTGRLEWPPPFKTATEKYAPQVHLNDKGECENYVAGLPFPLLDPNDPQIATKVMWNFSYRPQYTDDADIREVEATSYASGSKEPIEHFMFGHFEFYNNVGRTEVQPIPNDPEASGAGIRYRFAAFPMLEPMEMLGFGIVRFRYRDPSTEDNVWMLNPHSGIARRVRAEELSDAMPHVGGRIGAGGVQNQQAGPTYANTLDPDSYFGFSAKIEDYTYRLIAIRPMLAAVEATGAPATPCQYDGARSVCPENWEMRQLYVIEAIAKPLSWHQRIGGAGVLIPRRILYIDSEGWFITASDQFDNEGKLWKTIATFNAYRDRPIPDAHVAIFPFKRMFQTALVDEDLQTGFSTVLRMPGIESQDHESWYINMGIATKAFIDPHQMAIQAHY